MLVRLHDDAPLHLQIYRAFREAILEGRLAPGSRLPSSRAQAETLGVSRNVVLQAYGQLAAEGYLDGAVGSGTYVTRELPEAMLRASPTAEASRRRARPPRLSQYGRRAASARITGPSRHLPFDFVYSYSRPDATTLRQWQRWLRRAVERLPVGDGAPEGDPRLRREIAGYLHRSRGVVCEPEQVVVVGGSQQALSLSSRVLFEPGDAVVLEDPCYQGARDIFAADGLRLSPSPVDGEGLVPELAGPARGCYVTPSHQFPSGVTMPLARRLKLLAWAAENDAVVIEDDYDSEYRYEGRPLEAIQSLDSEGRVLYVGTLSKVLFPALRLGFVVLPEPLVRPFVRAKWLSDRHTALLEQRALAGFLGSGEFEQHLRRTRARNAAKRAALLEALEIHLAGAVEVTGANAGIHLLAWLPGLAPERVEALVARAEAEGVGLYSIAPYYSTAPERAGLLFGYGNLDERDFDEGVRRVARALEVVGRSAPTTAARRG